MSLCHMLDFPGAVFRTEICPLHGILPRGDTAGYARSNIGGGIGCPHCAAGIAGCRLNPDIPECAPAQQLAVCHTVQGNAACHDKVLAAGQLLCRF